jgi:hypothetical protein
VAFDLNSGIGPCHATQLRPGMFWLWACKPLVAIKFCFRAIVLNLRLAHIKLTATQEITPYKWVHPDEESRVTPAAFQ